jgi:5-enolpyruvylshikimate-3-phosphate synthase
MTVQYTSIRAYNQIACHLPDEQHRVFDIISQHPEGMTIKEIARALMKDANEISGRIDELRKKGLIVRGLKKFCRITGKLAFNHKTVTTDPQGRLFLGG